MKYITLIFVMVLLLVSCFNEKIDRRQNKIKMRVSLTTIFTNDLDKMTHFFNKKVGLEIKNKNEGFIEFKTEGIRFAIGEREVMYKTLKDTTYLGERKGAAVGMGFYFDSRKELDQQYERMKKEGVFFNQKPTLMPWNEYTAFFKDPDGNIHELISD